MFLYLPLRERLSHAPAWVLAVYAAIASFGVYFCMYAFRKPFTVAGFEGLQFLQVDYKVWLVIAQVMGYMLSKFYGIRFISSLKKDHRAVMIVRLILIAWAALLLFALVPAPYDIIFLLINGFPLGMVWGIVFSYLEGRKTTEITGSVLSASFIFSSGFVKTAGKHLLVDWKMSEQWMPFIAAALFLLPMLLFTWLLHHVPPPSAEDISLRTERKPMTQKERASFISAFLPGLVLIVGTYILLTVLRDFRDNFANELWTELGYSGQASIFTRTEIPVFLMVLFCMALLAGIRNNLKAFLVNHYMVIAGYAILLLASVLFRQQYIGPVTWMTMLGTGLYMSYIPFNSIYFDRMIASFRLKGNVGFLMYLADSFGYLGSVLVLFIKEFASIELSWTSFFGYCVIIVSITGMIGTSAAAFYFKRKFYSSETIKQPQYAL